MISSTGGFYISVIHLDIGALTLPCPPLFGRLILLVEDEPLIALDVEGGLRAAGARVVPTASVEFALYIAKRPQLSAAVVDLRLGKDDGVAVCRRLHRLGVPFVIYTGYPAAVIANEWADMPVIKKPARINDIVTALARVAR